MKLLFVHSNRFYRDKHNNILTGGAFPSSIWKNYLINFERIVFYGRLAPSKEGLSFTTIESDQLSFHLIKDYRSATSFIRKLPKIKAEIKALLEQSDILVARLPSFLGYLAIIEATKQNKPIWVEQVGNGKDSLMNHGSLTGKIISYPADIINKVLIKKANFISYVTDYQLQKAYPPSKYAITVALSDVVINSILTEEDIDKSRYFSETLDLALIGNLDVQYKGQHVLLEAISKLPKHVSNKIYLSFIGGGSAKHIESKAKELGVFENIKFMGSLSPGDEINTFLSKTSLYIQPSFQEGLPRATVEAMAMGCPVIGSNAGGLPELINSKLIHNKGDSEKLAQDIFRLFKNRNLLYEEALRSLKHAEKFQAGVLLEKRKDFYEKLNKSLSFTP